MDVLQQFIASWEQLDPAGVGELFTENGRYEDPLLEGVPTGPTEIRASIAVAMEALRDVKITTTHVTHAENIIWCEGRFESALTPTNERLDFDFAAVIELDSGRIVRLAEYFDTGRLSA